MNYKYDPSIAGFYGLVCLVISGVALAAAIWTVRLRKSLLRTCCTLTGFLTSIWFFLYGAFLFLLG